MDQPQIQSLLETLFGEEDEDKLNVYFQPPENLEMEYPCIVYQRDDADTLFADNHPYHIFKRYQVTVIDEDPNSLIPGKIAALPTSSFSRFFVADKLNHDVYNVFF